jgi:hypothetical protein
MERLGRAVATFLLFTASILMAMLAWRMAKPVYALLIPFIGVCAYFIGRPTALFIAIIFASEAQLMIPGIPQSLKVPHLLSMLLIGWSILDAAIIKTRRNTGSERHIDLWMFVFMMNMFLIMAVRGFGMRIFGSGEYGGISYVLMIINLMAYFSAVRLNITDRQVKAMMIMTLIATIIPISVQVLVYFSEGATILTRFIDAQVGIVLKAKEGEEAGIERWSRLSSVAYAMVPVAYLLVRNRFWRYVMLGSSCIFVGLTGFRSRVVRIGMTLAGAELRFARRRKSTLIFWLVIGLVVWVTLIPTAKHLPLAVQRSISFIPLITVDATVAKKAQATADWRFEMWRDYCIPNVPKYIWIGRGMVKDITAYAWLQTGWYGTAEFYYHMQGYHSGPFSLLLDWGLAGTLSFTLFFLLTARDAWRVTRSLAGRPANLRTMYFEFLTILLTVEITSYFLIFGSVNASLPRMLILAAQLRMLKRSILGDVPPAPAPIAMRPAVS